MVGISSTLPILPLYAKSFGVNSTMVGFIIASFGITRFSSNVPSGRLASVFGEKRTMILGLFINGTSGLIYAAARSPTYLFAARIVQGIGSAMYITSSVTIVVQIAKKEREKYLSIYQSSFVLGGILGPYLGGVVAKRFGLSTTFIFFSVLAYISAILAILTVKAKEVSKKEKKFERKASIFRLNREILVAGISSFSLFFALSGVRNTLLPLFGKEALGIDEKGIGVVITTQGISTLVFLLSGQRLYRKGFLKRGSILAFSLFGSGLSIATLSVCKNLLDLFLVAIFSGIFAGIASPAPPAYAADSSHDRNIAEAMGIYRSFGDMGAIVGPVFSGFILDLFGFRSSFLIDGVVCFIISILVFISTRSEKDRHFA